MSPVLTVKAHWLAVEGVQPSIPQNPTTADARSQDLLPKGAGANPNSAAINGTDSAGAKPLVKHVLSKEQQIYFERICNAIIDEHDEPSRLGAFASIRSDPGVHQLTPYFVNYAAEKVTHYLKNLFILRQMLELVSAMLDNGNLFLDPYVTALIPPVLTCLISPHLGSPTSPLDQFPLRAVAASIMGRLGKKFGKTSFSLRPRIARTCLKQFLDPKKPLEVHYGAILGLKAVSAREGIRALILPNLKEYATLLQEAIDGGPPTNNTAEYVIGAIMGGLRELKDEVGPLVNGFASGNVEAQRTELAGELGPLMADRIIREGDPKLVQAVLESAKETMELS